jgi:hypothetical protein
MGGPIHHHEERKRNEILRWIAIGLKFYTFSLMRPFEYNFIAMFVLIFHLNPSNYLIQNTCPSTLLIRNVILYTLMLHVRSFFFLCSVLFIS